MPGVKKLHQESENFSKAEYIFGHMFGGIGVLSGNLEKFFCIPLLITLQDDIKFIFSWKEACHDEFKTTELELYGKKESVSYYAVNLLWGQKLYQKLRFVLVRYQGKECILVSTDLEQDPKAIIRLYSYRFKKIISEDTMACHLRKSIFHGLGKTRI